MGLFKKRVSTKEEQINETAISHKIVKLSYLQTLAVTNNLASVNELAGETEGKETEISGPNALRETINLFNDPFGISRGLEKIQKKLDPLTYSITKGLFGKSISTEINGKLTDSGWHVVKSFLNPESDKIRYAIGIRELGIAQFTYEQVSELVSKVWISPKAITKVTLIVDEFIPPQFDPGPTYIDYYIKPELEGEEWRRINPLGGRTVFNPDGSIIPRIINFNNEKPINARLEDAYITTKQPVKAVRFRAVLRRPDSIVDSDIDASSFSPRLNSFRMLLFPSGGL
jgi:hypothetical protein